VLTRKVRDRRLSRPGWTTWEGPGIQKLGKGAEAARGTVWLDASWLRHLAGRARSSEFLALGVLALGIRLKGIVLFTVLASVISKAGYGLEKRAGPGVGKGSKEKCDSGLALPGGSAWLGV